MGSDGTGSGGVRAGAICHRPLEMGALGDVLPVAAEGAFKEVEGRLRSSDAGTKRLGLLAQGGPALRGFCGGDQASDRVQGEPRLLGAQDDGDTCEVGGAVAAVADGVTCGGE